MSAHFQSVPLVDISSLASTDPAKRWAAAQAMGRAAREVGFLCVTGHGFPARVSEDLLAAAKAFFAMPLDAKMRSYIGGSSNHSGYVPTGEEQFVPGKVDAKEAFDINLDLPGAEASAPMLGANLWPEDAAFKAAARAYYAEVAALARRMFRGFALALGLAEDAFDAYLTSPPSQLRLIHYPFDPSPAAPAEGIGAHTDYEFFTILRSTAPGLEVMNGAGEWIDAPPIEGAFIVNIGDMLEAWTNGEFVATSHRVRPVAEERYSFPFFATVDYWTTVAPHPDFVSEARPPAYPTIVSGDHLFAQTVKTFAYLKGRQSRGELDFKPADRPQFGQIARQAAVR